jgi:Phasin protein
LLEAPFPQAAREFAETTVDQTREAYERYIRALEAVAEIMGKSFDAAGRGAAALRRNIVDATQRNLNLSFDLAKSLAGASNLSEIVELQAAFCRRQLDAVATQAEVVRNRLFELGAATTVATLAKSINHELARDEAAPKKSHNPAATDAGAEGPTRGAQGLKAPPATGSTARPPDETQRGTRPTARVSAGEEGKQKSEPRPGLVAPPAVRPPDEKQSVIPTKGAPQNEALEQSLPAEIKFGMLDGNAVRFTSREAWWLVDGVWRPISPAEVLLNAAVMREARYDQFFPEVPPLPSRAFKADI